MAIAVLSVQPGYKAAIPEGRHYPVAKRGGDGEQATVQILAIPEEPERIFVPTGVFEVKRAAGAKAHGRSSVVRAAGEKELPGRFHCAAGEGYLLSRQLRDCGQLRREESWPWTGRYLLPSAQEQVAGGGWGVLPRELARRRVERQVPVTSGLEPQFHGLQIPLRIQYNLKARNQSPN